MITSDILTEVDGFPSQAYRVVQPRGLLPLQPITQGASPAETSESIFYLQCHLWLRDALNKILHDLYTPNKAYAHPYELAESVGPFSSRLRQWYRALPIEYQFIRDLATFNVGSHAMTLRQVRPRSTLLK